MENHNKINNNKQVIELKPKINGFLISYIIFSIPGFIISLVTMVTIVILVILGIVGLSAGNNNQNKTLTYRTIKEGKANNSILVYDLNGPISVGSLTLSGATRENNIYTKVVENDFAEIKKDKNIKGVVFRLNTPGGEASASKILGDLIEDLNSFYGQSQAIFYFDSIAASGGLLAAYKNNNYIVGSPYGETGSIGVILTLPNYKSAAEKIGYSQTVIKSSDSKDIGSPFRDPTNTEIKYLQSQVDKEFANFKKTVETGRKLDSKAVDKIANGYVYENTEAIGLGLIDEVGDLDSATKKSAENNKIGSDYQVIEIKNELNFIDSIFASQSLSQLLSVPQATSEVVNRATFFKPGNIYLVDEYKL